MNKVEDHSNLDSVITYVILKKLSTPIIKSPAYLLGLVNASGKKIKNVSTEEEKLALTVLDELIFWIKRSIGGKISSLNQFIYTSNSGNNFYNKLQVIGNIDQRSEIIRIKKDLQRLSEKYNMTSDDLLKHLIAEEVESQIEGK
jgi:hypothetical protein